MKLSKDHIITGSLFLIGVLVTLQWSTCKNKEVGDKYYEEKLADEKTLRDEIKVDRDKYQHKYDSAMALLSEEDTVLIERIKEIKTRYENIPVRVGNMPPDSLFRAIRNY